MPSISSVLSLIKDDYPEFVFEASESFSWSCLDSKITYSNDRISDEWPLLLHELAHGLLKHNSYKYSLDLLQIERDAWDYATVLSKDYNLVIPDSIIEQSLDTYRDWLHRRSTCPGCSSVGIEYESKKFQCPECLTKWIVNDGRMCALRRYKNQKRTP